MKNDYSNIKIYHGSDVIVEKPTLNKCKDGKDFGKGFYVSLEYKQAINFSKIIKRRNGSNKNIVNEYLLKDLDNLKVYEFNDANEEWLDCIVNYRNYVNKNTKWDDYDVLIGKIADDDTSRTINAYLAGAYGDINSKQALKTAVKMFKASRLSIQICFKTQKALNKIAFVEHYEGKQ